jgi:hypothetical protein
MHLFDRVYSDIQREDSSSPFTESAMIINLDSQRFPRSIISVSARIETGRSILFSRCLEHLSGHNLRRWSSSSLDHRVVTFPFIKGSHDFQSYICSEPPPQLLTLYVVASTPSKSCWARFVLGCAHDSAVFFVLRWSLHG